MSDSELRNVPVTETVTEVVESDVTVTEGPAAAAVLGAGVGALALGLATTVSEASTTVSGWFDLYSKVGPLSGKTIFAVVVWLLSWAVLHLTMRYNGRLSRGVLTLTAVLIGLGVLGTFPTFFDLFAD
jgi:hypothetical protein